MTVKKVLRMGEPSLLQPSQTISEFDTPELNQLINDMWDTMRAENGAGLAAPQIGINKQLVIFGFEHNERYPEEDSVPQTILINPIIEPLSDEQEEGWEGCLSIPGLRGLVPRHTHIRYTGFDEKGEAFTREVKGFHARVVQHECDHLFGILYPHRMSNMQSLGYTEELEHHGILQTQPCDD